MDRKKKQKKSKVEKELSNLLHLPAPLWLFSEFGAIYKYSDLLTSATSNNMTIYKVSWHRNKATSKVPYVWLLFCFFTTSSHLLLDSWQSRTWTEFSCTSVWHCCVSLYNYKHIRSCFITLQIIL